MSKIAFDVDDTVYKVDLLTHMQVPDYKMITVLTWFYENGHECYLWSAGGTDYATMIARKLGISHIVRVIPKYSLDDLKTRQRVMDIAFDDCETNLAKVDIKVQRPNYNEIDKGNESAGTQTGI